MITGGGRTDDPGTLLAGRYRLNQLVGRGGMSSVWHATDELLGRDVAVKRVRVDSQPPAEATLARERTMREARIAAALHHPHIVAIFDVINEGDTPWLILEYLPSRSLGSILAERADAGAGALPPAVVAAIGAPVAAALAAAHAAGIVHRDVKPDNILVAETPDGGDPLRARQPIVKLTDFGISHTATAPALTMTGAFTGTPAYFAPETARGEATDPRSDVYSLGATLYAAVEGHPPYGVAGDDNMLGLLARIGRGDAPPPDHAGPLTGLIRHLMADDPGTRPTAAQAQRTLERLTPTPPTAHAGQTFAQTPTYIRTPTYTLPPEPWAPPATRSPRRRIIVAAIALLAVAAVATAVAIVVTRDRDGTADVTPPVTAISLGDPTTADPCSLVDLQVMNQHGRASIDRDNSAYAECRVDIVQPDGSQSGLSVTFRSAGDEVLAGGTRQQLGQLVLEREADLTDNRCAHQLTLPDRTTVYLEASTDGGDTAGLCAIAEAGTTAAVRTLETRAVGRRPPGHDDSVLARTDACFLLGAGDLAAVPGLAGAPLIRGFAGWSCEWDATDNTISARVYYAHTFPLTAEDGVATDFGGRPGAYWEVPALNACTTAFTQRFYTASDGTTRIDAVRVSAYGTAQPGTDLCQAAVTLAQSAAARLPPPG